MIYKVEVTEKLKAVVEVNARSVNEALSKAERKYYNDNVEEGTLQSVEFSVDLGDGKYVRGGD